MSPYHPFLKMTMFYEITNESTDKKRQPWTYLTVTASSYTGSSPYLSSIMNGMKNIQMTPSKVRVPDIALTISYGLPYYARGLLHIGVTLLMQVPGFWADTASYS